MGEPRRRLSPGDRRSELLILGAEVFGRRPEHPHGAWAAYMGMGRADPVLRGADDVAEVSNDRQADRIIDHVRAAAGKPLDGMAARDLHATVYGSLAFTFELCRQRVLDPSLDADVVADTCAHSLLDAGGRVPGIPAQLAAAVSTDRR